MKQSPRILFVFTESREGRGADTALRGMNHIPGATSLVVRPQSLPALRQIPQIVRADVVIAQDNFLLGYLVSRLTRTKWVYLAIHSSTLLRRHARHPLRLLCFKAWWRSYARIACLSREQMRDLEQFGIPRGNLVFMPFGIDADFFTPAAGQKSEDLVASVGRDRGRDYATLLAAAAWIPHPMMIVTSRRNVPIGTVIPQTVSLAYDWSMAQLRDLYARAAVVVVPSTGARGVDGSDCSGQTVILDALAAGKAVVATERAWISDYFSPGEDLITVPAHDAAALADAVNGLMEDRDTRERLGASGRRKVLERYTTKHLATALRDLAAELL